MLIEVLFARESIEGSSAEEIGTDTSHRGGFTSSVIDCLFIDNGTRKARIFGIIVLMQSTRLNRSKREVITFLRKTKYIRLLKTCRTFRICNEQGQLAIHKWVWVIGVKIGRSSKSTAGFLVEVSTEHRTE